MRTFVAVVLTSVLTALAVHVVDANAAGTAVEAERFVVRDADGNVRVSIDEHGLSVIDRNNRTRAAIRVGDDGGTPDAPFGRAQIWVSGANDSLGAGPNPFAGGVEMTDGVFSNGGPIPQRMFEPKIEVFREPGLNGVAKSTSYGTVVGAGKIRLTGKPASFAGSPTDRVTLDADDPAIEARGPNGRVRFRR